MHILIAPDKFKGSLTATEAARAIARGWKKGHPGCTTTLHPLADGGEGFTEALVHATGGKLSRLTVHDALMRPRRVAYGWLGEGSGTAVIEVSRAAGMAQLSPKERNPMRTTTYGVGEMMAHAARKGARRILLGLGGSATNDGGIGIAMALGFRFLDKKGRLLPPQGDSLEKVAAVEKPEHFAFPPVIIGTDVTTKLLGKNGGTYLYGPQKGGTPAQLKRLDEAMGRFARLLKTGAQRLPGSGAAGGVGFGMAAMLGAEIVSGFELVAKHSRLEQAVRKADLVITGEGSLDAQTSKGKAPEGLRRMAKKAGVPIIALAGRVETARPFDAAFSICQQAASLEEASTKAPQWLARTAEEVARLKG